MYRLCLQNRNNNNDIVELTAINFPVICTPLRASVRLDYPHLDGLELADYDQHSQEDSPIDILIGSDHYWNFVTGEISKSDDGPTALKSKLGWLLSGYSESTINHHCQDTPSVTSNLILTGDSFDTYQNEDNDELFSSLKRFLETESIGITSLKESQHQENKDRFVQDIKFNGERYEVRLPWKEKNATIIDNDYELCSKRLVSLHNKLKRDPDLLLQYDNAIKEQLNNGVIERVKD